MSQLASGTGTWASDQGRLMYSFCGCSPPNWLLALVNRGVKVEVSGYFVVCL